MIVTKLPQRKSKVDQRFLDSKGNIANIVMVPPECMMPIMGLLLWYNQDLKMSDFIPKPENYQSFIENLFIEDKEGNELGLAS